MLIKPFPHFGSLCNNSYDTSRREKNASHFGKDVFKLLLILLPSIQVNHGEFSYGNFYRRRTHYIKVSVLRCSQTKMDCSSICVSYTRHNVDIVVFPFDTNIITLRGLTCNQKGWGLHFFMRTIICWHLIYPTLPMSLASMTTKEI